MIDSNKTMRFNRTLKEAGWDNSPIYDPDAEYSRGDKLVIWTVAVGFFVVILVNLIRWGIK